MDYDARNRVVTRKVSRNGFRPKIWHYEWDVKDRLIATITPEGERWTYHYDPFGRRVFKINEGAARAVQPADSPAFRQEQQHRGAFYQEMRRTYPTLGDQIIVGTAYLWDGDVVAQEAPLLADGEAAWAHATHWYYEPDTFKPIAKQTADGALFYIVTDHLGTPREMFSEEGHLVWAAHYRTWGAVKHIWQADNDNEAYHAPNPSPASLMRGSLTIRYDSVAEQSAHEAALDCPIRFQGQWEDAESGLYYNRHRYYDPLTASYLSPDPIGLAGGPRPNGYVHNPNAWIDPLGLKSCCKVESPAGLYKAIKERHGYNMSPQEMRNVQSTVDRIKAGKVHPNYKQDGTTYNNSSAIDSNSSILHTGSNYKEYVVPTPNIKGAGAKRIVYDTDNKRMYYTHDHYKTFIEINPKGW